MLVVCGGVKSILDVPKTLEALDARRPSRAGTRDFPAFFCSSAARRRPARRTARRSASTPPPGRGLVRRAPRAGARLGLRPRGADRAPPDGPSRRPRATRSRRRATRAWRAPRGPSSWRTSSGAPPAGSLGANVALVLNNVAVAADVAARSATAAPRPPAVVVCGAAAVGLRGAAATRPARRRPASCARRGGVGARAAARAPRRRRSRGGGPSARASPGRRRRARLPPPPRRRVAPHGADGDLVGGVFAAPPTPRVGPAAWRARASSSSARTWARTRGGADGARRRDRPGSSGVHGQGRCVRGDPHRCMWTPNEAELAALLRVRRRAGRLQRDAAALAQRAGRP